MKSASTQTETERTREFREGVESIAKAPDGDRKLRFIAAVMADRPIPNLTPDEVWRRYAEFCRQEETARA
jgi:hypothetical protein